MTSKNHTITPTSLESPLIPALAAIVAARSNGHVVIDDAYWAERETIELQQTVIRAGGLAWDIGDEAAAPLHAEIARLTAEKAVADAAAAAEAAISDETLRGRIAMRRWEEETKGVTVDLGGGRKLPVMTDATSQAKLTGLMVIASAQPIALQWKGSDGAFLDITNADVPLMAGAVFAHVQACFGREAALVAALESVATVDERAAFVPVVEQFWP